VEPESGGFFGLSVDWMHALPIKTRLEMSEQLQAAARAGGHVVCGKH
jgi:hypothetical protein